MNKVKKIPMRRCVVTNQRFEKRDLLRVVKTPEGNVVFDKTGKANGRGAYVSKDLKTIDKAKKTKILEKHLGVEIPETVYQELIEEINNG